jgi:hypothetical protein
MPVARLVPHPARAEISFGVGGFTPISHLPLYSIPGRLIEKLLKIVAAAYCGPSAGLVTSPGTLNLPVRVDLMYECPYN